MELFATEGSLEKPPQDECLKQITSRQVLRDIISLKSRTQAELE